jgi:hypothetical protein
MSPDHPGVSPSEEHAINGLHSTSTWDPDSTLNGAVSAVKTVTVTGAALGDFVQASFSVALPAGCFLIKEVSSANTVSVYLANLSGSTQDLASGTVNVRVRKAV